ncbi:class I SAM-dependent methyltransferase [Actinoalloteichus spitiensis]|uniref:class I SAM-dependent methyltransferase n=1 Tax=Actinoalloteichus spitiensis TaxID=252394 RepID=UPI000365C1FB|nr:class I SAM-dependent methyltransferase [Actinoalloteichus spitiensis]
MDHAPVGSADDRRSDAAQASSFGQVAEDYAEHRPGYPDPAVRWALEPVASRPHLTVLDLAAGTGKVTQAVRRIAVETVAVEPDPRLRAEFARRVPGVRVLDGGAEALPLPDASVDAVTVGQAFHWFDAPRALDEIARVLRPGGVVAALTNYNDDRWEWVAGLQRTGIPSPGISEEDPDYVPAHPRFAPVETARFEHAHRRTADSLVRMISTHSWVLVQAPEEQERMRAELRSYLAGRPETSSGEFDLPQVAVVNRAVRR